MKNTVGQKIVLQSDEIPLHITIWNSRGYENVKPHYNENKFNNEHNNLKTIRTISFNISILKILTTTLWTNTTFYIQK